MEDEAFYWANAEYERLFASEEWGTKYPNVIERQLALEAMIHHEAKRKFGEQKVGSPTVSREPLRPV